MYILGSEHPEPAPICAVFLAKLHLIPWFQKIDVSFSQKIFPDRRHNLHLKFFSIENQYVAR